MSTLDLSPAPGSAPFGRMATRQAMLETRMLLRNGEQLVLTLAMPLLLVLAAAYIPYLDGDREQRLAFAVPGTIALAILASAFTSLAISTGFERRYGVLRYLGATPLGRSGLLVGKAGAIVVVEAVQIAAICALGLALGWRPDGNPVTVILLVALGTAAFAGLALLLAGILRADATLAVANFVFLLLLLASGMAFPLNDVPDGVRSALELLPSTALAHGLRAVLAHGEVFPGKELAVLACWAAVACAGVIATFRWE